MIRQPFAWETDRAPERVVPDLDPAASGSGVEVAFPGAAELARRIAADPDPNRARRGAAGAASQVHADLVERGLDTSLDTVRDRVNAARARAAAKRR